MHRDLKSGEALRRRNEIKRREPLMQFNVDIALSIKRPAEALPSNTDMELKERNAHKGQSRRDQQRETYDEKK